MATLAQSGRVGLDGISSRSFEHPTDRAALYALRKVPGFDLVLRKMFGLIGERSIRYLYLANAVRVSDLQFARLHAVYADCLNVLNAPTRPELFVTQTADVGAGALGVDQPFIVLSSGTLDLFDDRELRFILGHELGHVLSGHALYKTMLALLLRLSLAYGVFPVAGVALLGILAALREWDRKSELTADRAGLLTCQDPEAAYRVHMKLAGGGKVDQMSVVEFERQADDYDHGGDLLDGVVKLLNLLPSTHPFSVLRLRALRQWVGSGEYAEILKGNYPRRNDRDQPGFRDHVLDSARSYRDDVKRSQDPLARFFNNLAEASGSVLDRTRKAMKRDDGHDGSK